MTGLRRNIFILLAAALLVMLPSGCVHEFPDPSLEHDVVLKLTFDRDLPVHKTVEAETKAGGSKTVSKSWTKASDNPDDYTFRHVIQIYKADDRGGFDRKVFRRVTVAGHEVGCDSALVRMSLPAGQFRFIVWSDHVTEGELDFFYNTQNFEEIMLCGDHVGSNDLRDSFRGAVDSPVRSGYETVIPISMERPMAKYTFISTDFEDFRTKVLAMLATKAETDTKTVNLEDYKVVFNYTGFMPSSYNLYTMKPADSRTGVSFETRMSRLDDHSAELGFDYVFVNGSEGSVDVSITTYDMDGNVMARSKPFNVPLLRSRHTVVKGEFLTTLASGSIGIDTEFDGEFNVEIK